MSNTNNTSLLSKLSASSHEEVPVFAENSTQPGYDSQIDEDLYRQIYNQKGLSSTLKLPLLGNRSATNHVRFLMAALVLIFAVLITLAGYVVYVGSNLILQLAEANTVKFYSSLLTKNVAAARSGNPQAIAQIKESHQYIHNSLNTLQNGVKRTNALSDPKIQLALDELQQNIDLEVGRDIKVITERQGNMLRVANAVNLLPTNVAHLHESIGKLETMLQQRSAPTNQVIAVTRLDTLIERIDRLANEFYSPAGISSDSAALLNADLHDFASIIKALLEGSNSLAIALIPGSHDFGVDALQGNERAAAEQLQLAFTPLRSKVELIPQEFKTIVATRRAKHRITENINASEKDILLLQQALMNGRSHFWIIYSAIGVGIILTILCAAGMTYVQIAESRRLQKWAEAQNRSSQAGILRLMDELQHIAEGDLTQGATVTEDITGSIADSVNATVEDLRSLVSSVQSTADKVITTTADVELVSSTLLEAATEQLSEILSTGQAVVDTASRFNAVSVQAQESAAVAQRSRQAAEQGYQAVQNSIAGMNLIREQIQDTAKRIKRLGESSQEIGEITELISDITDQTNVLALNAAIQAASAGDAGRGFSVVAEEVQRLAERSAEATQQITALIKTIQTDTQDAITAMERSTQGVVQGAQLSDNAGQTLNEINQVSSHLADLIQAISATANQEAQTASAVANNIQQIFNVTEQTTEGIRVTSREVNALSKEAQDLRTSVARFKTR